MAGSQDNGTQVFASAGMNTTNKITPNDNDGGYCFIDQDNPTVQIATYIENQFFVSSNGGSSFNFIKVNEHGQFINQWIIDNTAIFFTPVISQVNFFGILNPGLPEAVVPK
jgi:hypothetical protein